jgi:hypothetical protein
MLRAEDFVRFRDELRPLNDKLDFHAARRSISGVESREAL